MGSGDILFVSSAARAQEGIEGIVKRLGYNRVSFVKDGTSARRILLDSEYGMVIINTPLSDEFGDQLASHICQSGYCQVIVLTKAELYDEMEHRLSPLGAMTLARPLSKPVFEQAVRLARATGFKIERLRLENDRLRSKLEELKVVSRAKCILMRKSDIDEDQAHRLIEKQAMDTRRSRLIIAREIIDRYSE